MTEHDFHKLLVKLWPTYKISEDFSASIFRRRAHFGDELMWAVKRERADHPDAYKPLWERIDKDLRHGDAQTRQDKTELQILLDSERRMMQKKPFPGWEQLSDQDVYAGYIRANTLIITHDNLNNWEPKPDPDGRRARNAENRARWDADHYAQDLEERRLDIPPWLEKQRTPEKTS